MEFPYSKRSWKLFVPRARIVENKWSGGEKPSDQRNAQRDQESGGRIHNGLKAQGFVQTSWFEAWFCFSYFLFIHLCSLLAIVMVIVNCYDAGRCVIQCEDYIIMNLKIFWRSFRQSSWFRLVSASSDKFLTADHKLFCSQREVRDQERSGQSLQACHVVTI